LWKVLKGLAVLALVVLAGYVIYDIAHSQSENEVVAPDTPPGEYLYLDRTRVHSYLSQIVEGLAESEKRTLAKTEDLSAELKAGVATLAGKSSTSTTSEGQIKPTSADRFYLLLRLLRQGISKEENENGTTIRDWLFDLRATPAGGIKDYGVYNAACRLREGDFVRIRNAHLSLSPYAAMLPKVTYAVLNRRTPTGSVAIPDQKLFAARTKRQRRQIRRYQHRLGKDPRLPFVVRTVRTVPRSGPPVRMTFFIPALYSSLRNEPSLISGTLTVVGKVVYLNLARPDSKGRRIGCNEKLVPTTVPKRYIDRQTVATFVPALNAAPPFIYDNLRFSIGSTARDVTANMTMTPPMMVVVPIAMYQ
jgi:hypothetical protein